MKKFILILTALLLILSGCNASKKQFSDIIEGNVAKIVSKSDTAYPNKIVTYATNDKEMIDLFLRKMRSMSIEKTDKSSSVFNDTFELYDENNTKIATLVFTGEDIATINNIRYKISEVYLRQFTDVFYTDKYLIKKK